MLVCDIYLLYKCLWVLRSVFVHGWRSVVVFTLFLRGQLHVAKCCVYVKVNCHAKVIICLICLLDTSKLCRIMHYLQYESINMCTAVYDNIHLLLSPQNKEVGR